MTAPAAASGTSGRPGPEDGGAPLRRLPEPVLVVSGEAGRGGWSLAEALRGAPLRGRRAAHRSIEALAGPAVAAEDRDRHRRITTAAGGEPLPPALLALNYRRKNLRERFGPRTDLSRLHAGVRASGARSLVAVGHRPAFWLGWLLHRNRLSLPLAAVAPDFVPAPGWFHLPPRRPDALLAEGPAEAWEGLSGLAPVLPFTLPARPGTIDAARSGRRGIALLGGGWGLGGLDALAPDLARRFPDRELHVCCGDRADLADALRRRLAAHPLARVHGPLPDLAGIYARCAAAVTKPGAATLVECRTAGIALFLLPGISAVEAGNAAYARATMGARDYAPERLARFLAATGAA